MGTVFPLRTASAAACTLLTASLLAAPAVRAACPALDSYYPQEASHWPAALQVLRALENDCLQSAEYYALLGAGQLDTGQLVAALESFERALLLDPSHGAAQIDYAEALYLSGQLFPALELNGRVLQRPDTPDDIAGMLRARQALWQRQTRRTRLELDIGLGYDDNLNGGPSRNEITLTLSGEPVQLTLDEAFQPVAAPYSSVRLTGLYQQAGPEYSQDLVATLRSRNSEHTQTDLLQLDWRYNLGTVQRLGRQDWRWNLSGGTSHMLWGGSPLFSVAEGRFHLRPDRSGCQPTLELATQYQVYHGQRQLSGLESGISGGLECRGQGIQGLDAGYVSNNAQHSGRPGGNREGWRLRFYAEQPLWRGSLSAQLSLAGLQDASGYSDLLADNARRKVSSRLLRLQYRQQLQPRLEFTMALNRQEQGSNLGPFRSEGSAVELGFSYLLGGN